MGALDEQKQKRLRCVCVPCSRSVLLSKVVKVGSLRSHQVFGSAGSVHNLQESSFGDPIVNWVVPSRQLCPTWSDLMK